MTHQDIPGYDVFRVDDAGMVLLWPFLPHYFASLGMVRDGQFVDAAANHRAVHLMRFLASGEWALTEPPLLLSKVMCGLSPSTLLMPTEEAPTESELVLSDSLLRAVIQRWAVVSNTSIEALRETFLMHNGLLECHAAQGAARGLEVQRKGVDVLVDLIPWSISSIQNSWMPQPLSVRW